jgi:surface protein
MNQPLSWNTSKVTNMSWMFRSNTAFNQNISAWDTSKVTDFVSMFYGATAFNQNIGNWNTSSAVNMENMFRDSIFNQNIAGWDFSKVVNMISLFTGSTSFSQTNYDALLARWSSQPVLNNVRADLNSIKYSAASQAARDYLTGTKGWTIYDAGVGP